MAGRRVRAPAGSATRGGDARRSLARHDDALAVDQQRGEVDGVEVGAPGGAAGPLHRVERPRARRQPVDARPPHGARDVHRDVERGLGRQRRRRRVGRRRRRGPRGPAAVAPAEHAPGQRRREQREGAEQEDGAAAGERHGAILGERRRTAVAQRRAGS